MKNNIRLIATDLDGTLIRGYSPDCSDEAIELISRLASHGVYVVPASGRQYYNLKNMFSRVDGELMYLCENGALVIYENEAVLKNCFERELALELCQMVIDNPHCEVLISGERTCYVCTENQEYVDYLRYHIKNDVTEVDKPDDISEDIIKVSFFVPEDKRAKVNEEFAKRTAGRCIIAVSGNEWVDFAPIGTSKGDALRELGEKLGISADEMAAFGDNENDRTMLEYVGHPYLMSDGNPSMMDIEARRCDSVEAELAEILADIESKC